jgi:hypothetical protein
MAQGPVPVRFQAREGWRCLQIGFDDHHPIRLLQAIRVMAVMMVAVMRMAVHDYYHLRMRHNWHGQRRRKAERQY